MSVDPDFYINLAATGSSDPWIVPPTHNRLSVTVDAATWSTAQVTLEWSLDGEVFHIFSGTIRLSSSLTGKAQIPVGGMNFIRLRTSTAAGGASASAGVHVLTYKEAS